MLSQKLGKWDNAKFPVWHKTREIRLKDLMQQMILISINISGAKTQIIIYLCSHFKYLS